MSTGPPAPNVHEGDIGGGFFTPGMKYNAPPGYKDLYNAFGNFNFGIGKAGKFGKQIMQGVMGGNADQDPRLAGFFNPIRNAYATNMRDLTRNVDMRSGLATGQQLGLLNAQEGNAITGAGEQMGMQEQNMVPGLFQMGANLYNTGRQQEIGSQEFGLTGQENLLNMLNQSKQSTPSIMQDISGVANLAGQIMSFGMMPPGGINAPGYTGIPGGEFGGPPGALGAAYGIPAPIGIPGYGGGEVGMPYAPPPGWGIGG